MNVFNCLPKKISTFILMSNSILNMAQIKVKLDNDLNGKNILDADIIIFSFLVSLNETNKGQQTYGDSVRGLTC